MGLQGLQVVLVTIYTVIYHKIRCRDLVLIGVLNNYSLMHGLFYDKVYLQQVFPLIISFVCSHHVFFFGSTCQYKLKGQSKINGSWHYSFFIVSTGVLWRPAPHLLSLVWCFSLVSDLLMSP